MEREVGEGNVYLFYTCTYSISNAITCLPSAW